MYATAPTPSTRGRIDAEPGAGWAQKQTQFHPGGRLRQDALRIREPQRIISGLVRSPILARLDGDPARWGYLITTGRMLVDRHSRSLTHPSHTVQIYSGYAEVEAAIHRLYARATG